MSQINRMINVQDIYKQKAPSFDKPSKHLWNCLDLHSSAANEPDKYQKGGYFALGPIFQNDVTKQANSLLSQIQVGPNPWQRIGARVNLQQMIVRGNIAYPAAQAIPENVKIRYIIAYDRQPNATTGAPPLWQDIVLSNSITSFTGLPSSTIHMEINPFNRDRFIILRDRTIHCVPTDATGKQLKDNTNKCIGDNTGAIVDGGMAVYENIDLGNLPLIWRADLTTRLATGDILMFVQGSQTLTPSDIGSSFICHFKWSDQ